MSHTRNVNRHSLSVRRPSQTSRGQACSLRLRQRTSLVAQQIRQRLSCFCANTNTKNTHLISVCSPRATVASTPLQLGAYSREKSTILLEKTTVLLRSITTRTACLHVANTGRNLFVSAPANQIAQICSAFEAVAAVTGAGPAVTEHGGVTQLARAGAVGVAVRS